MEVSGIATVVLSVDSLQRSSHASSVTQWKQLALRCSLHCRPGQGRTVLDTIRVATELNPHLTVLSIDGVGAYDHVYRASMLAKLVEVPGLRGLLPFVKTAYSRASSFVWADEEGVRHTIEQHEGGEQGDFFMPLLFSLGIQNALEEVRQSLEEGECLFA